MSGTDRQRQGNNWEGWPEEGEISELVKCANGSFLWANTFIAFILDGRGGNPKSRLADILQDLTGCRGDSIHVLCAHVLNNAYSHLETDGERETMLLILAFLAFQNDQLSRTELEGLLMRDISTILDSLSPIFISGAADEPVRFNHLYYRVFMSDINRLPDFLIPFGNKLSPAKQKLRLAQACLRFMKRSLAAQADGFQKSTTPHPSVNASRAGDGNLTNVSKALKYACSYWVDLMDDICRWEDW